MTLHFDSFVQWNMQSYRTKFNELKLLLNKIHPACVALQETLIGDRTPHPPAQYRILTSEVTRDDGHERGTALLIHRSINHSRINLNTNLQAVAAKMHLQKTITVCSVYLPHIRTQYQDLDNLITQLHPPYLILGDFNARSPSWGAQTTDGRGRIIEQLITNHNISILNNNQPTHYHKQNGTYSIIDLSICSSDLINNFTFKAHESRHNSDHYPLILEPTQPLNPQARPVRFSTRRANWTEFEERTAVPDGDVLVAGDINAHCSNVTGVLYDAATASIPRTSGAPCRPPVPWWDRECARLHRERVRAERAKRRNDSLHNLIRLNRAEAMCKYHFNRKQDNSLNSYLSSINSRTPMSQVWRKVNRFFRKPSENPTPALRNANNEIVHAPKQVANVFASHLARTSDLELSNPDFIGLERRAEAEALDLASRGETYNGPITQGELDTALGSAKETSPGHDEITNNMIKHSHTSFKSSLLRLYNEIFLNDKFPTSWLMSTIIPIPKADKNPNLPSNYRPIALTSCLCKLLERILNSRLTWFLETGKVIAPEQSGFRQYRSTTDHLVQLETSARLAMAAKHHLLVIFFDLRKAYDTAWRFNILKNLHNYGLRGYLMKFIQNFLRQRGFKVRLQDQLSDPYELKDGIPQGSVLSCSLFLVAINDISRNLPQSVRGGLYVDDYAIWCAGPRLAALERQLQLAVAGLERWSRNTGFTFSTEKTKCMHICRVRGCQKPQPQLTLNQHQVEQTECYKYLGMHFDNSLTWKKHITLLKASCLRSLNLLKFLSSGRRCTDRKLLLRLYLALVKPKLDYGVEAYGSACPTLLSSLQPVQNSAMRIATGTFRSSPIVSLHAETGLKNLKQYNAIKMLNYLVRLHVSPDQTLMHRLTNVPLELFDPGSTRPAPFYARARTVVDEHNLDISNLLRENPQEVPPWCPPASSCSALRGVLKSQTSPEVMRCLAMTHLEEHETRTTFYTDGSKTAEATAFGVVRGNRALFKRLDPRASVYTAELCAIYSAILIDRKSVV